MSYILQVHPASPYPGMNRERFENEIEPYLAPKEFRKVMRAYQLSKYGHRNQVRIGDPQVRYFEHPRAIALIHIDLEMFDWRLLVLDLIHDLKEDSYLLDDEAIQKLFGRKILLDLKLLTRKKDESYDKYIKRLSLQGNWLSWSVKLADFWQNLCSSSGLPAEARLKQAKKVLRSLPAFAEQLIIGVPSCHHEKTKKFIVQVRTLAIAIVTGEEQVNPSLSGLILL